MGRQRALVLVCLLFVAGCTGGPGGPGTGLSPEPSDAGTDSPNPTRTATPTVPNGSIAPGVTDSGVRNVSVLLAAHTTVLLNRGFELTVNRTAEYDGQQRVVDHRLLATADLDIFRGRTALNGNETVQRQWANATMTRQLIRITDGSTTRYHSPPIGSADSADRASRGQEIVARHQLQGLLRNLTLDVTGVDRVEGERRYTLVGNATTAADLYADRDVRLTVSAAGVIRSLDVTGTLAENGPFAYHYRIERLDVETVDRPSWVADAPTPVAASPNAGFENCTAPYLTLHNPGPDAVPAGSVIRVGLNGSTHEVTLESPLGAEERVALYLDSDGTLRITGVDAVPVDRTGMPNEASVTVRTGTGLLLSQGGLGFGCNTAGEGSAGGSSSGPGT